MNPLEKFVDIRNFIFDVDGVLAPQHLLVTENGELLRQMSSRDGYAIRRAIEEDYRFIIITGGKSSGVTLRLRGLGVTEIYSGIENKLEVLNLLVDHHQLLLDHTLYMGDDLPDHAIMLRVALPVCPADAASEIMAIAQYVSPINGGYGCVRDVIEKVMKLHNSWLPNELQSSY